MNNKIGLVDDSLYSTNGICGRIIYNGNDPYYEGYHIGQDIYGKGSIICTDYKKIVKFLENRIIDIISSKIEVHSSRPNWWWFSFNKFKDKDIKIDEKKMELFRESVKYEISFNHSNGDFSIKLKKPRDLNTEWKQYNHLCDLAEILDSYYLIFEYNRYPELQKYTKKELELLRG